MKFLGEQSQQCQEQCNTNRTRNRDMKADNHIKKNQLDNKLR